MKQITSISDIKELGTILGVWAHPDDQSWLSAGIMITVVKNGQQVACICATRGEIATQVESILSSMSKQKFLDMISLETFKWQP